MTTSTDFEIIASSSDHARLDKAVAAILRAVDVPGEVKDVTVSVLPAERGEVRIQRRVITVLGAADKVLSSIAHQDKVPEDVKILIRIK